MIGRKTLFAMGFMLLLSASLLYVAFYPPASSCGEKLGVARISRFQLPRVHFDSVTKFRLPDDEFPNGIAVAPDGSAWFGEQNIPGLGRLFPNGTMIEFAWPINYSPSTTSIWGVVQWNGRIWASDALGGQIVSLDSVTGVVYAIKLSNIGAFPYTITLGPDDALWFTELFGAKLGRIDAQCKLTEFSIPMNFGGTPTQVEFQNSSYGYYLDAGNASNGLGELLSFGTREFAPQLVDGTFRPLAASSLTLIPTGIWVAQHASANLAYYDFANHAWSQFPTTPVSYIESTLPYFVAANGSLVWFNEHYANRMAVIDTQHGLLTEYNLANPPPNKTIDIDNALTFALAKDRAWFTELTANYIGYVDGSYRPNFTISGTTGNQTLKLKPGENATLIFTISDSSNEILSLKFADTENYTSRPNRIVMNANVTEIKLQNSHSTISVTVKAARTLAPGTYALLVSVTDGSIDRGVYVLLQISE